MEKKEINQNEASKEFNVSRQYINTLIKENKITLNKNNKLDYDDVKNYFDIKNKIKDDKKIINDNINIDKNEYYLRKLKSETELKEVEVLLKKIDLEERQKNLIDKSFIINEIYNIFKMFNDNIVNIPKKISPTLKSKNSIFEIEQELKSEIEKNMNNILLSLENLQEKLNNDNFNNNIDDDFIENKE